MGLPANAKGVSTIALILLIIVSAVIGGIISYAFTIVYYTEIPGETTVTITGVYINPENVQSFNISILNPSYSPGDANITWIALSLKKGMQLYEVVETNPSIKKGLIIRRGESVNITCTKIKKDNIDITFGEFVSLFPGERVFVHVFAEGSPAANMETSLPYVKLEITADFNSRFSFQKFNITLTNSPRSEVNLTITTLAPGVIMFEEVHPDFRLNPIILSKNETICFQFTNANWYGFTKIRLDVYTAQGYIFRKEVEMKMVYARIQAVSFDEEYTDRFNVTIYNFAESANPVHVKEVVCKLENGSKLTFPCGLAEIIPNSTKAFMFFWDWWGYRGKNVTVVAYFAQDFETPEYTVQTPSPVMVKILNAASAFDLKNKESFNIAILNHKSSFEAVNITKIVVKRTGEVLPISNGVIGCGNSKTFSCVFNWALFLVNYGRNLTLTIYAVGKQTLKEYTFDFSFTLPVAELNVTAVAHTSIGGAGYLNLTIKNLDYSIWNLTLSKIVISVQDLNETLEYMFPENHLVLTVGSESVLLCPFNWQNYVGKRIIVTVITKELIEASTSYTIA